MIGWTLAAALTLGSLAAVAAVMSAAIALVAHPLGRRVARTAPSDRASWFFALRMLPLASGAFVAYAIVLPTFLWFEPADAREAIAPSLALAALAGAWLSAAAARRAVAAWRATRALAHTWRAHGVRLASLDAPLPVYAIDEDYPIVAVVGFRRPELFISRTVLRACSDDELRAMVRHECAHVAAHDNLKRFALRASAGTLPGTRALDALWASAAEEAADAAAAASRPDVSADLAQALIRVARLAVKAPRPLAVSAFYSGGSIDARVRRLLECPCATAPHGSRIALAVLALVAGAAATALAFAPSLHHGLEALVRSLP